MTFITFIGGEMKYGPGFGWNGFDFSFVNHKNIKTTLSILKTRKPVSEKRNFHFQITNQISNMQKRKDDIGIANYVYMWF